MKVILLTLNYGASYKSLKLKPFSVWAVPVLGEEKQLSILASSFFLPKGQ
jgi:hypothetical protein